MLNLTIGETTLTIHPGLVETTLPSGKLIQAAPHYTEEYHARACNLGYRNGSEMNELHDLTHVMLARWLGLKVSVALEAASRCEPASLLTDAEEEVVLALQRFANLAGIDLIEVAKNLS